MIPKDSYSNVFRVLPPGFVRYRNVTRKPVPHLSQSIEKYKQKSSEQSNGAHTTLNNILS